MTFKGLQKTVVRFSPRNLSKFNFKGNLSHDVIFSSGESGSFVGDRIQLNLNVSQVEMGSQPADALIFINFTAGANFAFLLHAINTLVVNLSCTNHPVFLILILP